MVAHFIARIKYNLIPGGWGHCTRVAGHVDGGFESTRLGPADPVFAVTFS
jgi:hypothetical protein